MKSVGETNTDGFTDGLYPSVNQSSVNLISVANSVANKKNHTPTETPTVIQTDTRAKKKFLAGTLPTASPTGFPSVCMARLVILLQLSV
jgi:hypothetical protein